MTNYSSYVLPKSSVIAASINNVLSQSAHPWPLNLGTKVVSLRPVFFPLQPVYSSVLSLQVGDAVFYLSLQKNDWCLLHSAFDDMENAKDISLPAALEQALLENLASPIIDSLSTMFELNISIIESFVQDEVKEFSYETLQKNNQRICFAMSNADNSKEFLADLWIPNNYNISNVLSKLRQILPMDEACSTAWLDDVPVSICFEAGHVALSSQSFIDLECGDVFLPDKMYIKSEGDSKLKLTIYTQKTNENPLFTFGKMSGDELKILEDWQMNKPEDNLENAQEGIADEDIANNEETLSLDEALENLEVSVVFELERRSMNLQDAKNIAKGYTFALECDNNSPVTLRVNGKNVGMGRLVDMDGLLGVEVVKLG